MSSGVNYNIEDYKPNIVFLVMSSQKGSIGIVSI